MKIYRVQIESGDFSQSAGLILSRRVGRIVIRASQVAARRVFRETTPRFLRNDGEFAN